MTKLIIQIPCYNEAETLPQTLGDLPRELPGISRIEWLVIDDGSTDGTPEVALAHGADHIVELPINRGLARAFSAGLEECIRLGADVIVNTDADNQYKAKFIGELIKPIVENQADLVVGARPIDSHRQFSRSKKLLSKLGSWVVRIASGTKVLDAPSGFRAISRNAALRMSVFNNYTYTLETLIQAGQSGLRVVSIPVDVNDDIRPSRLIKSIPGYIYLSLGVILRIFVVYQPFRFFTAVGGTLLVTGILLGLRFLWFYAAGDSSGHIQSLVLATILAVIGSIAVMTAFIADLLAVNRRLLEELIVRARKQDFGSK
jgi:glycosyltransferase involved in cell wall biosynthesis